MTTLLVDLLDLVHISFGSVPVKVPFGGNAVRLSKLQNSFSLSFCTCSMSFQHLKHLASACSAGTLECHRRSQIALETLLSSATGQSKG